jgi:hypothetical protein
MHEVLRAKYDFHLAQVHQASIDHHNAAQAKGVEKIPELHAVVAEKEANAQDAWKEYTDHVRKLPGATEHEVSHNGKEFVINHLTKPSAALFKPMDGGHGNGNGNGNGNGHGNDHDDDDDDDHDDDDDDDNNGNRLKRLGRLYEQLLVNNTRTINAAVRLYNIANDTVCDAYMNALRQGRFDGEAAINAMLNVILTPNAKGTIQPNFHVRPRIPIVSYFMLACAGNSSRVVKETFTSVIAWNNRVMYNMYFTLRAANGVDRLLTHVGEARVNPDGRVCGFKANFQRLGFGLGDAVLPPIANFDAVKISQNNTIVARCQTIQQICPVTDPTLKQFDSVDACYNYFSTLPNGGWERSDQRDRGCAFNLHLQFAPHRPDLHCVHVGPTGGGFCVPNAYNDIVLSDPGLWTDCVA